MIQGLYAITPSGWEENDLLSETEVLLKEGVKLIQYRDKIFDKKTFQEKAKALLRLTKKYEAKLLINDHVKICLEIGADGFHLGLEDYSSEENLELLKKNKEFISKNLISGYRHSMLSRNAFLLERKKTSSWILLLGGGSKTLNSSISPQMGTFEEPDF